MRKSRRSTDGMWSATSVLALHKHARVQNKDMHMCIKGGGGWATGRGMLDRTAANRRAERAVMEHLHVKLVGADGLLAA